MDRNKQQATQSGVMGVLISQDQQSNLILQLPEEKVRLAKMLIDFVEVQLKGARTTPLDDVGCILTYKLAEVAAELVK